ncbi:hypothetical protein [Methylorubrum sp. SB2]|uniref:hypothetical protein n=1 Tax=Methylorubrum subtropicum TaxID=3138812 RepID=UPI00313EC11F
MRAAITLLRDFAKAVSPDYLLPMTKPVRLEGDLQRWPTAPVLFGTVALRSDQTSWDGERVPAGASGTVVEVLKGGEAYVVDVVEPFDAVVTVVAHELNVVIDDD